VYVGTSGLPFEQMAELVQILLIAVYKDNGGGKGKGGK
jgi:hypothetical protein